jgi:peptidase A4-like protein
MKRRLLGAAAISLAAASVLASSASAATATDVQASSNWAGYSATGTQFSKVSGSWVQPAASCDSGTGDAAFWVGLGGATGESNALEQTGTEVDCTSGTPAYSAWYELVPAAPVTIDMQVKPGDKLSATVGVNGDQVAISLKNETTGKSFNKTLQMDQPDTTSAEWIAEAPSACQDGATGQCQTLPLADFGKVDFTNATATTADGQTGPISAFDAVAMQLSPSASGSFGGGQFGPGMGGGADATSTAAALPSELGSDGTSFSVAWSGEDAQAQQPQPQQDGGYGYDPGAGSGYGTDPGSGYGTDPGSGYGYDPGAGNGYGDGSGYGYDPGYGVDPGYGWGGYSGW